MYKILISIGLAIIAIDIVKNTIELVDAYNAEIESRKLEIKRLKEQLKEQE